MPALLPAGAEEKAPLPAAQEEGHPPTSAITGERRCKHSIIAQSAVGRDNFGFRAQRRPAVAAAHAAGFLQESTRPRSLRSARSAPRSSSRPAMTDVAPTSLLANAIRALAMDAVEAAKSGHPGMPMGMAEIAVALWNRHLVHNPANPHWANRDRFVISNGHGSMLLYALLHLTGYDLPMEELKRFRQLHSKTPGHPEFGPTPGVETTTGPLGQGLANAVGMALAERLLAAQFNRPGHAIVDHRTYCFVGDGCLMEGISHEAGSLAGTLGLVQADRALRRQRHLDRRRNEGLVHRRHARPLRGLRLERDPARRRPRRRSGRPRDPRRAPRHRPAHAHLLQDRSSATARRTSRGRPRRTAPRSAKRKSR